MKYHLPPVRMAIIKKTENNRLARMCKKKKKKKGILKNVSVCVQFEFEIVISGFWTGCGEGKGWILGTRGNEFLCSAAVMA